MNVRFNVVVLAALCAQTTLTATTSYNLGTPTNASLASSAYVSGAWTEVYSGTSRTTTEQIDCAVALANISNVCGNPGPGSSAHISIPAAPGNTGILPGGTAKYLMVDGDPAWGAPVWTNMTGLTVGDSYQVSFYQASSEENGNNKAYNDHWQAFVIPGASTGVYICPVCSTPVDPVPADLAFTSATMANTGAVSTPWQLQTFTFKATNTSEVLEFVTDAIATSAGAFMPPLLALAGVSTTVTPEPGTWAMVVLGAGLLFAGRKMRRRSSADYKRVING